MIIRLCPIYRTPGLKTQWKMSNILDTRTQEVMSNLCYRHDILEGNQSFEVEFPCGVWYRGSTTCLLYANPMMDNGDVNVQICHRHVWASRWLFLWTFLLTWINLIPKISNLIHYKLWDEITNSYPNFYVANVVVWEWISYFIPHLTGYVITYPCRA